MSSPVVPMVAPTADPSGKIAITPDSSIIAKAKADGCATIETVDGNYIVVAIIESDYPKLTKVNDAKQWDLRIRDIPIMKVT